MNIKTCMAAAAALMISWSAGASAAPMVISSVIAGTVEDDIMRDGTPDDGFQSSIVVRLANWENRGIIEFDTNALRSAIAGGAVFNSARLELTTYELDWYTDNFLLHVYGYTGNGQFNIPDFSLGTFVTGHTLDNDVLVSSIDVTDFVFDFLEGSDRYAGFNLRGGNAGFQYGFYQGRAGGPGPRLVLDYTPPTNVPEPASLALLGMGLVALGAARRRMRR